MPLLSEGTVIGVLHVGTLTPRVFTDEDAELLQLAADRAATTIDRARLFHQRGVVEALQQSLVPERLPVVPGLQLAARYRPAVRRGGIGGDWYDAFPLARGGMALVAGDVMGHGIGAAAMMAQMRTGLRAYALDGHSPADVVERLNRLALTLAAHQMTTLVFAVLDLDRERVHVVSAGHLPPVVRAPDGTARVLELDSDAPLGVSSATRYHEHEFDLPVGSTLVLVTDGADRGPRRERGARAGAAARPGRRARRPPRRVRGRRARRCAGPAGGRRRRGARRARRAAGGPAAHPLAGERRVARRRCGRCCAAGWRAGAPCDDEIYDITVAVQEASANAVEHAYAPGTAMFEVEAAHDAGVITVVIRDRGHWRAPARNASRPRAGR